MDFSSASFQNEIALKTTLLIVVEAFLAIVFVCSLKYKTFKQAIRGIRLFGRSQTGAGYSVSFILILPLYVFLIVFTLEATLLLIAKIGTIHMSLAAARAAVVHLAAERPSDRPVGFIPDVARKKARKAAIITATSTFAGGFDPAVKKSAPSSDAQDYLRAYQDYVSLLGVASPVKDSYILKRHASAEKRTNVELTLNPSKTSASNQPWKQSLTATVVYDAPFRFPLVGRCLGGKTKDGAVVKSITSRTTLGVECPQNNSGYLGAALPWSDD